MKSVDSKVQKFLTSAGFVAVSLAFWFMFLNCVL